MMGMGSTPVIPGSPLHGVIRQWAAKLKHIRRSHKGQRIPTIEIDGRNWSQAPGSQHAAQRWAHWRIRTGRAGVNW